jgi:catechol 2,3-dioxygenase-like lactoylglutathione lyase family enzyme
MLKKVAFTMYPIRDVVRARRFYEETLGLTVGMNGNQGDQWWIEYDLPGGGCVALTNFIPDEPSAVAPRRARDSDMGAAAREPRAPRSSHRGRSVRRRRPAPPQVGHYLEHCAVTFCV